MNHSVSACGESNLRKNNTGMEGSVCSMTQADLKKKKSCGQRENCKLSFIWGKTGIAARETAPHLDSSEKLLQRSRWQGKYTCDLDEGGIQAIKHVFFQKVPTSFVESLLVTRNSHRPEGFWCFSKYEEM